MSRKSDIEALLARAEKVLPKIIEEYEKSLHSQTIHADLRIDIKDFFGNLRSVLDYIAHDIVDKYCPNANKNDILYFPIRGDKNSFEGVMKKSYPDLDTINKKVYDILEQEQPYIKAENQWLTQFNKLNNENKHDNLVPQTRQETKRVNVDIEGGGSVNWNPSGVRFGSGVYIGGVPVDPNTQMPVPSSTQTVTAQTWVDFHFDDINVSAIWLTQESMKRIRQIYESLKSEL